jgi:hypothetical protein
MKLAVVGSRDLQPSLIWKVRWEIQNVGFRLGWDDLTIVSGGARGADAMAAQVAHEFHIPFECYPADWKRYGKRAGMLRNQTIVDAADEMLAFFGNELRTPGTADSVRRAIAKGIPVRIFEDAREVSE